MTTLGELLTLVDRERKRGETVVIMDGTDATMRGVTRSDLWKPHEERIVDCIRARDGVLRVWLKEEKAERREHGSD